MTEAAKKRDEFKDLLPDRVVTVKTPDGQTVEITLRAFRFIEYFPARALAAPILDDLSNIELEGEHDTEYLVDQVYEVFAQHPAALVQLIAMAIDRPVAWVEALDATQAQRLFYRFLDANHAFFLGLLAERSGILSIVARMLQTPNSESSSQS